MEDDSVLALPVCSSISMIYILSYTFPFSHCFHFHSLSQHLRCLEATDQAADRLCTPPPPPPALPLIIIMINKRKHFKLMCPISYENLPPTLANIPPHTPRSVSWHVSSRRTRLALTLGFRTSWSRCCATRPRW